MTWLAITLGLGFVVLAYLVMRMRIELRDCAVLVRGAIEVLAAVPDDHHHSAHHHHAEHADADHEHPASWPAKAAIQPGSAAPPPLKAITDGGWAVALLAEDPEQLGVILAEVERLGPLRSRYQMVVAFPDGQDLALSHGLPAVPLPESLYDHLLLPAAAMIGPDGTVEGIGPVMDGADLLTFVHEGELHGYGPETELNNTVPHAG